MSRNSAVIISTRSARFTNSNHDEIELIYPHEGNENDKDNGRKTFVYYDHERYAAKQAKHGHAVYPEPTPFEF